MPDGPLFDGSQNQTDIESVDLEEAGKILEAAGIEGKDRLDSIAKVRRGEYTLDDLRAAFPQKEPAKPDEPQAIEKKADLSEDKAEDPVDTGHLLALEARLSNERARLANAKGERERQSRAVLVRQIEKEVATERAFLKEKHPGWQEDAADAMDDDALLGALLDEEGGAEPEAAPGQATEKAEPQSDDDRPTFSLRPETKAAYEARIDALFAGGKAKYKGAKILDRADILDILGHGDKPLHLVESAVGKKNEDGSTRHPGMTAEQWKRVPEWIENPVAVFRSDTVSNRLTLVAPETVDGKPVLIVLEPSGSMGGLKAHVLVNAYEKDNPSAVPTGRWVKEQKLLFLDQKKSPAFSERSGLELPGEVRQLRGYARKVLTEADLDKYRQTDGKAETPKARLSADGKPVGIPRKEAQRLLNEHDASVKAVQSYADLDPEIRAEAERQGAKPSDIKGVHWRGKSWVVADNVTADEVARVALHEAMHGKLRQAYGREVENKMVLLASNLPGTGKASLRVLALAESQGIGLSEYVNGLNKDTSKTDRQKLAILTEELLTHVEEGRVTAKGKLKAYLEAVVGAIRAFFRKHGFAQFADYGITDIQHLLRQAREYGEQIEMSGEVPAFNLWDAESDSDGDPAFSLRDGDPEADALIAQYANADGAPSEAEIREARKQYRETERAYGGREAYEKAKAAGRTKLNYSQWVTVRTPNFKRWFGDWEIAGAAAQRLASTFDEARAAAKEFQGKPMENAATGMTAVVSRNNLDKMLNGKAVSKPETAQSHALAVANLDGLFARAILGWSKPDAGGDPNIKAIHRFFAPVVRDGQAMLAKMTVKETTIDNDPNPLYTVEAVEFNEKSPAAQWVAAASDADGVDLTSIRSAGDVLILAQRAQDFNPAAVSKVTDPTTGEPMVVYHATDADITEFDRSRLGQNTSNNTDAKAAQRLSKAGFWFSEKPLVGDLSSAAEMPVFIVINRPYRPRSVLGSMWARAERGEQIIKNGNDGVIVPDDEFDGATSFVVKNPTQIKSATGNAGTFGPASDIRFSIAPGAGLFDQDVRYRTDGKPWANRKNAEAAIKARGLEATHKPVQTKAGWVLAKAAVPPKETAFRKAQRRWQDKFNRFRVIQDWLAENGISLTEQADVYGAETLMRGRQAASACRVSISDIPSRYGHTVLQVQRHRVSVQGDAGIPFCCV